MSNPDPTVPATEKYVDENILVTAANFNMKIYKINATTTSLRWAFGVLAILWIATVVIHIVNYPTNVDLQTKVTNLETQIEELSALTKITSPLTVGLNQTLEFTSNHDFAEKLAQKENLMSTDFYQLVEALTDPGDSCWEIDYTSIDATGCYVRSCKVVESHTLKARFRHNGTSWAPCY